MDPSIRGIMRGSSCLLPGQTAHRCEGASGSDRAEGGTQHDLIPGAETPTAHRSPPGPPPVEDRDRQCLTLTSESPRGATSRTTLQVVPLPCCLAKLWPTRRGTACQRLISASTALCAGYRIKYSHGWLQF